MSRLLLILSVWFVCLAVIPDWTIVVSSFLFFYIPIWIVGKWYFKL